MSHPRRVGTKAEDRAADYLLAKGFTLLTRRFKGREGEIDVVALDGETLVFVEVKLRTKPGAVPEEAIDGKKLQRLFAACEEYLAAYEGPERPVRFDLVAIGPGGIRHVEDAFRP